MDRGAWRATVHGIAKSQTRLSAHTHMVLEEEDFKDEFSELVHVFWNGPSNLIRFKDANIFSKIYTYLFVCAGSYSGYVGSSSLTRDQTCIGSRES